MPVVQAIFHPENKDKKNPEEFDEK